MAKIIEIDTRKEAEAPAVRVGAYVGVAFALIFEGIITFGCLLVYAAYHFLIHWIGGR